MRRRPLLRAAVVGGVAHHAGKVSGENAAMREGQEQPAYAPPPAAPAPAASGGLSPAAMQQLKELGQLQQSGVLSSEEFEQQKAKLLAASG